jgi:hypothetical protein
MKELIRWNKIEEWKDKKCVICGSYFSRMKNQIAGHWRKKTCCSNKCSGIRRNQVLAEGFAKKFPPIECRQCKDLFQPKNQNHFYCGSKKYKTGCSWKNERARRIQSSKDHKMYGSRKFWNNTTKIAVR